MRSPAPTESIPLSYAETRNIVFPESAVLGHPLFARKRTYEQNH